MKNDKLKKISNKNRYYLDDIIKLRILILIKSYRKMFWFITFWFISYETLDWISYKSKKWYYMCFFQNYAKIKIDSYDPLPQEKILSLHNVVILIKSVFNKNQNH